MSDARAIEAVTKTLLQVIDQAVNTGPGAFGGGVKVIAKPPHDVETDVEPLQVNLFLYRTEIAAGLRNEDPIDVTPGETANPPLPLVLHYLMTPYVQGGKDLDAHRLLGLASRAVHEQAELSNTQLNDSSGTFSNVAKQLDRIRITWQQLAESDIYSLWSAFQTPYRLSAAFEVRAVLIDGRQPPRSPLPVISRGELDDGPEAFASVVSPFPELDSAAPPARQPAVRLGETFRLLGRNLVAQDVQACLTHPLLASPVRLPATAVSDTAVSIAVPSSPQGMPAGLWSVRLELTDSVAGQDSTLITNEVALALAPKITSAMPITVPRGITGNVDISLRCAPWVVDGQTVFLMVGSRSPAVPEDRALVGTVVVGETLTFVIPQARVGTQALRLRVGGVDSLAIDRSGDKPRYLADQVITVTP